MTSPWKDQKGRSYGKKRARDVLPDIDDETPVEYEIKEIVGIKGDTATVSWVTSNEPLEDYVLDHKRPGKLNQQFLEYMEGVEGRADLLARAQAVVTAESTQTDYIVNPMIKHVRRIVGHTVRRGAVLLKIEWVQSDEPLSAIPTKLVASFWKKNPDHPDNPEGSKPCAEKSPKSPKPAEPSSEPSAEKPSKSATPMRRTRAKSKSPATPGEDSPVETMRHAMPTKAAITRDLFKVGSATKIAARQATTLAKSPLRKSPRK